MALYRDECKCPRCGKRVITDRRTASAGKVVRTYCYHCCKWFTVKAAQPQGAEEGQKTPTNSKSVPRSKTIRCNECGRRVYVAYCQWCSA
jgi:hypothetical protein